MWPKSIILWLNTCNCFLFNSPPSSTPHPLRCHIILQHNIFLLAFVCSASYWPWERINRCAWLEIVEKLMMKRIFRCSKRRSCSAFLISKGVVVSCQPQKIRQIWLSEICMNWWQYARLVRAESRKYHKISFRFLHENRLKKKTIEIKLMQYIQKLQLSVQEMRKIGCPTWILIIHIN